MRDGYVRKLLAAGLGLAFLLLVLVLRSPSRGRADVALRPEADAVQEAVAASSSASVADAPHPAAERLLAAAEPPRVSAEASGIGDPARGAPALDARVRLFQHAHLHESFPGDTWTLGFGLTDAGFAFRDDDASAIEIPESLSATLYDGIGGTGRRIVLGPGMHNLDPYGLNDRVSSVRVMRIEDAPVTPSDAVVLYRDVVEEGVAQPGDWRLTLPPESTRALFSSAQGDFEALTISALLVPPGFEASLFEQPDGRGIALVLGPGYHELEPAGFNDRVRSVHIARSTKR